jgi:hypothetical protein
MRDDLTILAGFFEIVPIAVELGDAHIRWKMDAKSRQALINNTLATISAMSSRVAIRMLI